MKKHLHLTLDACKQICKRTFIQKITLFIFLLFAFIYVNYGQISITKGGVPYTQDFNTLASAGYPSWSNNVTLLGWYSTTTSYTVDNGGNATSTLYSYGTSGSSERALGAFSIGTTVRFGVRMTNNTGKQIISFRISYRGEEWRAGTATSGTATTLAFQHQVGTNLTSLTSGTWSAEVAALTFTAPYLLPSGSTATAVNGNAVGNFTNKSGVVNINVNPGQEIFFRWTKTATTNSHGLAIDDLQIIPITNEPLLFCSQTSLDFANTYMWGRRTLNMTIERLNLTGAPVLTMQSGAASVFSITPTALPQANGTGSITVTFSPTADIIYRDTLIISGGGLEEPVKIALRGTGIAPLVIEKSVCINKLPYIYGDSTLTTAGNYPIIFKAADNSDSVVLLSLTTNPVYEKDTITVSINDGESFPFKSDYLTVSGFYNDTLQSIHFCDSIITYHLIVNPVMTRFYALECNPNVEITLPSCVYEITASSLGLTPPIVRNLTNGTEYSDIHITDNVPATFTRGAHRIKWTVVDNATLDLIDTCIQWVVINYPVCGTDDITWVLESNMGGNVSVTVSSLLATDFEGNQYRTVRLGCDCWLAENLKSTLYADGTPIENIYKYYDAKMYPDSNANAEIFGLLYTWEAAARPSAGTPQGACPNGWRLPANAQFIALNNHYSTSDLRANTQWVTPATNSTGFTALPAGIYNSTSNSFHYLMGDTYFWSITTVGTLQAFACHLGYGCPALQIMEINSGYGLSVRCVKE